MQNNGYDVIIIGAGATGAGTARDCAMRGLKTLLVERFDFTAGATGRNHGLLHSGARYAVTDTESASECIRENMILRRIASHCVEPTGGLFVTLPEDDLAYQSLFIESCHKAGIDAQAIDPAEALRMEPAVNPDIIGAVIDPFRLTTANVLDAKAHGADVLTYHSVEALMMGKGRVCGVTLRRQGTSTTFDVESRLVINAGGIWAHGIALMAGININMFPAKGALLIFGHRVNNVVINRCRKPADADILVPGDTISLIGTTSSRVPYEEVDNMEVTQGEVDTLLREGMKIAPSLAYTRILRAYAGVRPLIASDDDPSGRSISRGIVCLDHAARDGVEGIITISGGKLMTYRLMAEIATDTSCRKLGMSVDCRTADLPLPGSEAGRKPEKKRFRKSHIIELSANQLAAQGRHGSMIENVSYDPDTDDTAVCECEQVSLGETKYAIEHLDVNNLINLRRRTRLGMGTCQGSICACRASAELARHFGSGLALGDLASFVNERWKGMMPVAWGQTLVEANFSEWIYQGVCGLTPNTIQR